MSTTNEIMDLASEWAQETKDFGHLDESQPRDALLKAVEALVASCCTGRETMNIPPLPESLAVFTPTQEQHVKLTWIVREYGELCHKQALEEAYKWMLDRHEAQKHRDNYMLVEANRFKKELLTLPRVEQGSVPKQIKPNCCGEVVRTVTFDVVQAKDQPS